MRSSARTPTAVARIHCQRTQLAVLEMERRLSRISILSPSSSPGRTESHQVRRSITGRRPLHSSWSSVLEANSWAIAQIIQTLAVISVDLRFRFTSSSDGLAEIPKKRASNSTMSRSVTDLQPPAMTIPGVSSESCISAQPAPSSTNETDAADEIDPGYSIEGYCYSRQDPLCQSSRSYSLSQYNPPLTIAHPPTTETPAHRAAHLPIRIEPRDQSTRLNAVTAKTRPGPFTCSATRRPKNLAGRLFDDLVPPSVARGRRPARRV